MSDNFDTINRAAFLECWKFDPHFKYSTKFIINCSSLACWTSEKTNLTENPSIVLDLKIST